MDSRDLTCDILILAVDAEHELPAVLGVFDIPFGEILFEATPATWYWKRRLNTDHLGELTIAFTALVDQGNPDAGIITSNLVRLFQPQLVFLVGTAAGSSAVVKRADVIFARVIRYYEGARLETDGPKPRPKEKEINPTLFRNLEFYRAAVKAVGEDWLAYYHKYITTLPENSLPTEIENVFPSLKNRNIASGEKLLVDGSLERMRADIDNQILGGETEGYGFAKACSEAGVLWSVLRGVSDYGEPKSKDQVQKDKFHLPSVAAAASFCRSFIEHGLRMPLDDRRNRQVTSQSLSAKLQPLKIERVIISAGDKTSLPALVNFLESKNVEILATTGSYEFLRSHSKRVILVNDYIGCESIVGTRGTLHPYILAAIKVSKNDSSPLEQLALHGIGKIDAVIVNANPYRLPDLDDPQKILDQLSEMQVGAPAFLRWAVRQFHNCLSITSPRYYDDLIEQLSQSSMTISARQRVEYLRRSLRYLSELDREVEDFLEKIWGKEL